MREMGSHLRGPGVSLEPGLGRQEEGDGSWAVTCDLGLVNCDQGEADALSGGPPGPCARGQGQEGPQPCLNNLDFCCP